jgi:hypothetical protein
MFQSAGQQSQVAEWEAIEVSDDQVELEDMLAGDKEPSDGIDLESISESVSSGSSFEEDEKEEEEHDDDEGERDQDLSTLRRRRRTSTRVAAAAAKKDRVPTTGGLMCLKQEGDSKKRRLHVNQKGGVSSSFKWKE